MAYCASISVIDKILASLAVVEGRDHEEKDYSGNAALA